MTLVDMSTLQCRHEGHCARSLELHTQCAPEKKQVVYLLFLYIYIYFFKKKYICIISMCISLYIFIYLSIYISIHTYTYICVCVCVNICGYLTPNIQLLPLVGM